MNDSIDFAKKVRAIAKPPLPALLIAYATFTYMFIKCLQ